MMHRVVPEKYVQPMNPHRGCAGPYQRVDRTTGVMLGGCPVCWSKTTWRWQCSSCEYKTAWVEDNVAANDEIQGFDAHRGYATAVSGRLPMWFERSGYAIEGH